MRKAPITRLSAVVLAVLLIAGCDFTKLTNLPDDLSLIVNVPGSDVILPVTFVNAATGGLVEAPLSITLVGQHRDHIVEALDYSKIDGKTIQGGLVMMAVKSGITPSAASPIHFRLQARAPGYLDIDVPVSINALGIHEVSLDMIQLSAAPAGVSIVDVASGSASALGALNENISLSVLGNGGRGGSGGLLIPQNTVARDAGGQALTGGLNTRLIFADGKNQQAMRALFGDFHRSQVRTESGTTIQRPLAGAEAVLSYSIRDGSGKQVGRLQGASSVSVKIPGLSTAAKTGATYDVYGLWGQTWEFIKETTDPGADPINIPLNRPSDNASGEYAPPAAIAIVKKGAWSSTQSHACPLVASITGRAPHDVSLSVELWEGGDLVSRVNVPAAASQGLLAYVESNFSGTLRAYFSGQMVADQSVGGCSGQPVSLPVTMPASLLTGELDISMNCALDIKINSIEVMASYRRVGDIGVPQFTKLRGERINDVLTLKGAIPGLFPDTNYGLYIVDTDGRLKRVFERNTSTGTPGGAGRIVFGHNVPANDPICDDIRGAI